MSSPDANLIVSENTRTSSGGVLKMVGQSWLVATACGNVTKQEHKWQGDCMLCCQGGCGWCSKTYRYSAAWHEHLHYAHTVRASPHGRSLSAVRHASHAWRSCSIACNEHHPMKHCRHAVQHHGAQPCTTHWPLAPAARFTGRQAARCHFHKLACVAKVYGSPLQCDRFWPRQLFGAFRY